MDSWDFKLFATSHVHKPEPLVLIDEHQPVIPHVPLWESNLLAERDLLTPWPTVITCGLVFPNPGTGVRLTRAFQYV